MLHAYAVDDRVAPPKEDDGEECIDDALPSLNR